MTEVVQFTGPWYGPQQFRRQLLNPKIALRPSLENGFWWDAIRTCPDKPPERLSLHESLVEAYAAAGRASDQIFCSFRW